MFCSKCGAEAFGPFCASCGAEIIPPKSASEPKVQEPAPTNMPKANIKPTILLKSTNCDASLRETEKKSRKLINTIDAIAAITFVFFYFLPYIIGILNDENLKYVKPWPWQMLVFLVIIWLIPIYAIHRRKRITAEIYEKYMRYCSKETLIIDDQKIYGSTINNSVELPYERIRSINFTTYVENSNSYLSDPCCDILTIKDIDDKQYVFYSFANCREIKSVIDMQLKDSSSHAAKTTSSQKTVSPSVGNMWECSYCGTHNKNEHGQCKKCGKFRGSTQPVIAADGEIICPACGTKQRGDRKVCWNCGVHFSFEEI